MYTTHNLIGIVALISIRFTAISLPLCYSIIFSLSSIITTFAVVIANAIGYSFYSDHTLGGPMNVR